MLCVRARQRREICQWSNRQRGRTHAFEGVGECAALDVTQNSLPKPTSSKLSVTLTSCLCATYHAPMTGYVAILIGQCDGHVVSREFADRLAAITWVQGAGLAEFSLQCAAGEVYAKRWSADLAEITFAEHGPGRVRRDAPCPLFSGGCRNHWKVTGGVGPTNGPANGSAQIDCKLSSGAGGLAETDARPRTDQFGALRATSLLSPVRLDDPAHSGERILKIEVDAIGEIETVDEQ